MTARLKGRYREAGEICQRLATWGDAEPSVESIIAVGSYVRGSLTMSSDVDIVILTREPESFLNSTVWTRLVVGKAGFLSARRWGPVSEVRVRRPSGLQVELGIAAPDWVALPLDAGTRRVLRDGSRVLFDRAGLAETAIRIAQS